MKTNLFLFALVAIGFFSSYETIPPKKVAQTKGYILQHENDIRITQKSPHDAPGLTTAYPYFAKADSLKIVFRKRTLGKGSSIGYHYQKNDEIYYIVSGTGTMKVNNDSFPVAAGDAVLTRPDNWHGLEPTGKDSLTVIINYNQ